MAQPPLHVVAHAVAMADAIDEVRAVLESLVDATREEPGCLTYELFQNDDEPTEFCVLESYRDGEAFQAHLESPHFQAAAKRFETLLAEPPDIRKYSQLR